MHACMYLLIYIHVKECMHACILLRVFIKLKSNTTIILKLKINYILIQTTV